MNNEIGFFCKSFSEDFYRLKKLIDSFEINMGDKFIDISIPRSDANKFFNIVGNRTCLNIYYDEDYMDNVADDIDGWRQQQIAKLCSYRIATHENYLMLDSDMIIGRPMTVNELSFQSRYYLTASNLWCVAGDFENKALDELLASQTEINIQYPRKVSFAFQLDSRNYQDWYHISKQLDTVSQAKIINQIYGGNSWYNYQPGQVFSRNVLAEYHEFLASRGISFKDLILLAPWEYNWYGEWFVSRYHDNATYARSKVLHFQTEASYRKYFDKYGAARIIEKFPVINFAARHYDINDLPECIV